MAQFVLGSVGDWARLTTVLSEEAEVEREERREGSLVREVEREERREGSLAREGSLEQAEICSKTLIFVFPEREERREGSMAREGSPEQAGRGEGSGGASGREGGAQAWGGKLQGMSLSETVRYLH